LTWQEAVGGIRPFRSQRREQPGRWAGKTRKCSQAMTQTQRRGAASGNRKELEKWEPLSPALSPQAGRERMRAHDIYSLPEQISHGEDAKAQPARQIPMPKGFSFRGGFLNSAHGEEI